MRCAPRLAAIALLPALLLAGCGGDETAAEPEDAASASPTASPTAAAEGLPATSGDFGEKPVVAAPEGEPPAELVTEVLVEGDGEQVAAGDLLVANYLGQTWEPEDGEPNVFDNSYDRGEPAQFPIGVGQVIPGWDEGLVGRSVGDRVLLVIPPAQAYGEEESEQNELGGQTLIFVVDVVDTFGNDAAASGTVVEDVPAGFPAVTSQPGQQPAITDVAGVEVAEAPRSALLIEGDGDPIDPEATLVMQVVATDAETGTQTQETWGQTVEQVPASQVVGLADALEGHNVGSRAVVVVPGQPGVPGSETAPEQPAQPASILVLDVVGQY